MKKILNQFGEKPLIRKEGGSLVQQEHIKKQISILAELESLIPPLLEDEYKQLEENIKNEGCREPLLVWQRSIEDGPQEEVQYLLIDGHNRYGICKRNSIDFKISLREFTDIDAVKNFMIDNQLGRRNLTPEQMSYLRGQKYNALKKKLGRPGQVESLPLHPASKSAILPKKDPIRTEQVLADQFKVSPKTIRLDASYAKGLDKLAEPLKKEVLARKVKLNKGDVIALGDRQEPISPIATPNELIAVLKSDHSPQPAITRSSADGQNVNLQYKVSQVVSLVQKLSYPSESLVSTCEEMIQTLQSIVNELKRT
ncbi:ParB N-terminal domain-containing protein [Spirosoma linguale]|uniref:ParB/Sulfiredoxin domain-containing protein n=1 Tax=Spirosoma linguale (strain ATCC 33905 / DSM 74 / LMG 10896 / Claus 1) TaxID=504472 RepID=D2QRA1_SPILD|nr:hypothetical protein Slin_3648 [Spirosoma linguale DSM 74]